MSLHQTAQMFKKLEELRTQLAYITTQEHSDIDDYRKESEEYFKELFNTLKAYCSFTDTDSNRAKLAEFIESFADEIHLKYLDLKDKEETQPELNYYNFK